MKKAFIALTGAGIIIFAACTPKASPAKIVLTTYAADVLPLIQAKCTPCHLPSKGGFKANFETFAGALKYGADMVTRIERNPGERGFMPMKNAKLSAEEIAVFKKWVSDGLKEN